MEVNPIQIYFPTFFACYLVKFYEFLEVSMWKFIMLIIQIIILFICSFKYLELFVPSIATTVSDNSAVSSDIYTNLLTMQSNQFSLLQVYMAAFGIVITILALILAVAALYGYTQLKDSVLKVAEDKINKELPDLVMKQFSALAPEEQAKLLIKTTMDKTPDNNFEKVFQQNIRPMELDPMKMVSKEDLNT